jgi:hypothetical protein
MTTKYEINNSKFTIGMFDQMPDGAWGVIERIQDWVEKALIHQDMRFDNIQNCTNVYTFLPNPLTILNWEQIPEKETLWWESNYTLPWMIDRYGEDGAHAACEVVQFAPEFGVTRPFTVWGYWSDENGAGGYFGFEKGRLEPTILFC